MSLHIKKVRGSFRYFKYLLKIPEISMQYIRSCSCFGLFHKKKIVAGFGISHRPIDEMFSIYQIPVEFRNNFGDEDPFKYAEITGYFLQSEKYKLQFVLYLSYKLLSHKASYFVYMYDNSNKAVEELVRHGSPLTLYSGTSITDKSIRVEIISKLGVLKILCILLCKELRKKF